MTEVRYAVFPDDGARLIEIWREYLAVPKADLSYQGNEAEFANLPGKYAAPEGCIILAEKNRVILGCVAMRKITMQICEMKRLFVRPQAQGTGLGRRLVVRLIEEARKARYTEMRLDVLPEFEAARRLYESLGFEPAAPVSYNPVSGTAFLGLSLMD